MAVTETLARPRLATLETLSDSQIRAIRAIPHHDQAAPPAIEASRPATIFTDDARQMSHRLSAFVGQPAEVTAEEHFANERFQRGELPVEMHQGSRSVCGHRVDK